MELIEDLARSVKQLKDNVQCPICFDILVDPVSTKCNHHFCSACHKKLFQNRGKLSCPVCHTPLTRRSCAKNSISLNPIVQAIKSVLECLVEDTGIDFAKEASGPASSREACVSSKTDDIKNKNALQIDKQNNEDAFIKGTGNTQTTLNSNREVDNVVNAPSNRQSRNSRQYSRKKQVIKPDDSFKFPADFIVSKKKSEEMKPSSSESAGSKVSSWLRKNETNLNDFEELSILNGSLPKKISPDLNVSSSDDELLSVSQVNTNSNQYLAPKKIESEIILDTVVKEPENKEEPEFKDPYEFVSSQKSDAAKHLIKTAKRVRKSYAIKKKPLGLDISRLVNEYVKKKKLNETTFQAPVLMNDTFDQLMLQKPQVTFPCNPVKKSSSHENDKGTKDNEIYIFQSQNKQSSSSEESLSDFSSGSGEEWGETRKEEIKQNIGRKSERVFQERKSTVKGRRKSESNIKSKRVKVDNMLESLNKNFEEVESYKLVTSSQVMREKLLNDNKAKGYVFTTKNEDKAVAVSLENEICTNETEKIDDACNIKADHRDVSRSPGWSRVRKFRNELVGNKKAKVINYISEVKNIQSKAISKNFETNDTDLKKNYSHRIGKKPVLKLYGRKNLVEKDNSTEEHSVINTSLKRNSTSPEEPVRYLNLSQSQERAKIMNEVVRSLESSLKRTEEVGCSSEANMYVSVDDLSAEWELIPTCSGMTKSQSEVLMISSSKTYSTETDMLGKDDEHFEKEKDDEIVLERHLPVLSEETMTINKKLPNLGDNQRLDSNEECGEVDRISSFSPTASKRIPEVLRDEAISKQLNSPTNHPQENSKESKEPKGHCNRDIVRSKKGILTSVSNEERCNVVDKETDMKATNTSENIIRKVRFFGLPVADMSENVAESDTSGSCVVFLKVGNFCNHSHSPKIKFWYFGTCMTESERQAEVTQWIIKVSKSAPICQCGNVRFEGITKKQTLDSSLEKVVSEKVMPVSQSKKNVIDAVTQTSISFDSMIERNIDLSPHSSIQDNKVMNNTDEKQILQVSVKKGVTNSEVLHCKDDQISKDVGLESQSNVFNQKKTCRKSSDEDIFNSEQKCDEPPTSKNENKFDQEFYNKLPSSSSSSDKLYDILPENKIVEPDRNCTPRGDIFLSCLDNNEPVQDLCKNIMSQDSFNSLGEGSVKNNKNKEISPLKRSEGKTPGSICKLRNNPSLKNCEEVLNTDTNADFNRSPLLLQDYKSSLSDSQNMVGEVGNKLNTGQDIFASGSHQSMPESIPNGTPVITMSNKKRVRPLSQSSSSSNENNSSEKPCKKSCSVASCVTLKDSTPRNLRSSVNIISDEDEDDLLNSEELLQKVMDNINEDLGYNKPLAPKSIGARKRILSDSEDDETEGFILNRKKFSKSPKYENQKNFLEDDIFNDNEFDNDKDIIEESPKKSVSDSYSKGKDIIESKYLSEKSRSANIFQDTSSKFILPHSSYSKKGTVTPKGAITSKPGSIQNDQKWDEFEPDEEVKSPLRNNVLESEVRGSSVSTKRNTPKKLEKSSPRKINILQKPGNTNEGLASLATKKTENVKQKLLFVCSGLPLGVIAKVKKFAQICGAGFSDNFDIGMTHLIVNVDENRSTPKTLKYLKAVAAKKWIVSYDWILACVSAHKLVPEDEYEAIDMLGVDGPRKSRLSSDSLFRDVQVCFVEPFNSITVDELQDLFTMCGGMVIDSPEAFSVSKRNVIRILVTDMEDGNTEVACQKWLTKHRAVAVISDWVLDSIGTYTMQPLSVYLVASYTNDQLEACGIPEKVLYAEDMESTAVSEMSELAPLGVL